MPPAGESNSGLALDLMLADRTCSPFRGKAERACDVGAVDLPRQHLAEGARRYELGLRLRCPVGAAGRLSSALPLLGVGERALRGGEQRLCVRRDFHGVSLALLFRAIDHARNVEREIDNINIENNFQEGGGSSGATSQPLVVARGCFVRCSRQIRQQR